MIYDYMIRIADECTITETAASIRFVCLGFNDLRSLSRIWGCCVQFAIGVWVSLSDFTLVSTDFSDPLCLYGSARFLPHGLAGCTGWFPLWVSRLDGNEQRKERRGLLLLMVFTIRVLWHWFAGLHRIVQGFVKELEISLRRIVIYKQRPGVWPSFNF
jgi:hypothetical protein